MSNYPPEAEYDLSAPWNDQSKTYNIRITAIAFTEVEVEASDYNEAISYAKNLYDDGCISDINYWNIKLIRYE